MAEGGDGVSGIDDLSRTLAGGHEEVFDWVCGQCEHKGKLAEAVAYCQDCERGYCSECLDVHSQFPVMQKHNVFGQSHIQKWGKKTMKIWAGQECPKHEGERMSIFCENHDAICCHVCIALDHKDCKKTHFIPTIAKNVKKSSEFANTLEELNYLGAELGEIYSIKETNRSALGESMKDCVKKVRKFKQKLVSAADILETQTLKETTRVHKAIDSKLQEELKVIDEFRRDIKKLNEQLNITMAKNDTQTFINMKLAQERAADTIVARKRMDLTDYAFFLQLDPALEELVNNVTSLGTIKIECSLATRYVVRNTEKCDIGCKKDTEKCFITGMCQLPDGKIVLSDYNNKKLKLIDTGSYKLVSTLEMPDKPRGSTYVNTQEVAIVLKSRRVQFVSVRENKIESTRSFWTGCSCYGIAHHEGKLFVSKMAIKIIVFDLAGSELFTIPVEPGLLSLPRHLTIGSDGTKLHIADIHNCLVTIDMDGKHLYTQIPGCLKEAFGVCLDRYGNAFVTGYGSGNVVCAGNAENSEITSVIGENEKLVCPIAICFDKYNCSLVVSSNPAAGCNLLNIFKLDLQ